MEIADCSLLPITLLCGSFSISAKPHRSAATTTSAGLLLTGGMQHPFCCVRALMHFARYCYCWSAIFSQPAAVPPRPAKVNSLTVFEVENRNERTNEQRKRVAEIKRSIERTCLVALW